jgi:precorrin-6Y C5,15-methyltransferase (decarboxylating)
MIEPIVIIGIGEDGVTGLNQTLLSRILFADEIWGSERLLSQLPDCKARRVTLSGGLVDSIKRLTKRSSKVKVVILASGDPGFFGIAGTVLSQLPAEEVKIFPAVSSLQLAFAHAGIIWQDAALTSAHARPVSGVIGLVRRNKKTGILTDPRQSPAWIAQKLISAGIPDCRAVVCENLGEAGETITETRLLQLPGKDFVPLNVLLLIHDDDWIAPSVFSSRPDSAYAHVNGMITKRDVRVISLERLSLRETDVVWDIGAGSGAVSIETAELAWRGEVYAVEKNIACLDCIRENVTRYGIMNLQVISGEAPGKLLDLPQPDAVFIGGSGGHLTEILTTVKNAGKPGCRIVANFTLLENLLTALSWMQENRFEPDVTEARFSYSTITGNGTRLVPSNPVYILSARSSERALS